MCVLLPVTMKAQSDGQNWHELEIWMAGKYAAESA